MRQPTVRAGNAQAFPGVIRSLGGDVPALLEMAGLPQDALDHPERAVSLHAMDRFLTAAETATGCDHLGLLAGAQPTDLGLPSFLFFNAPTLRSGLGDVFALVRLMNEGGSLSLQEAGGHATVRYANVASKLKGTRHITDCVIAHVHAAIAKYCSPLFSADEIRLPRRAPVDFDPYRRHFGRAKLIFNADEAAIDFPSAHLNHSSEHANPSLYRFLKSKVETLPAEEPLVDQIKRILGIMILDGPVRVESLAAAIGVPYRKLKRSLASDGVSVQDLLAEVRHETAVQLLQNTDLTLIKIAWAVGYSDASVLSRSFALREGVPPNAFRQHLRKADGRISP